MCCVWVDVKGYVVYEWMCDVIGCVVYEWMCDVRGFESVCVNG